MPEPLWIYLRALLYSTNITTCSAIADALDSASHDQLTRMLQGSLVGAYTPQPGLTGIVHGHWRLSPRG
jgi:hypothetical protein